MLNEMRLKFTKMQGLGNDFVVLDATRAPLELNHGQLRRIADRHFGVGCDQILQVEKPRQRRLRGRGRRHPARTARSARDGHYARRRPQYIMGGRSRPVQMTGPAVTVFEGELEI